MNDTTRRYQNAMILLVAFLAAPCFTPNLRAAEFIPLGFLPDRGSEVIPGGVSDDGLVVTGFVQDRTGQIGREAFRWTPAGGMAGLGWLADHSGSAVQWDWGSPISADGSTILGLSYAPDGNPDPPTQYVLFRDDVEVHPFGIPSSERSFRALSSDGKVAVGELEAESGTKLAFRWTSEDGYVELGPLAGDERSAAWSLSTDAATIVGTSQGEQGASIVRWASGSAAEELIGPEDAPNLFFPSVSGDGSAIATRDGPLTTLRWTAAHGVQDLGVPLGYDDMDSVLPTALNHDGSVIVGYYIDNQDSLEGAASASFAWSERFGMEDLQQALIDRHGFGSELDGWQFRAATDISADGRFIVGTGVGPNSIFEGFLIRLDRPFAAVPEPSTAWLIALAAPLLSRVMRRTRCVRC